jgi:hypothetical protein
MLDDFWHVAAAEIVVRHKIKMRLNFVGVIRGKSFRHRNLQALALDFCLFVIRFLISQVARSLVKQFPDKRFFPIGPRLCTCALAVSQSKQHQGVQIFLLFHDFAQLRHCGRVIKISLLRDLGEGEVMVD